jgi:hypothetical protein
MLPVDFVDNCSPMGFGGVGGGGSVFSCFLPKTCDANCNLALSGLRGGTFGGCNGAVADLTRRGGECSASPLSLSLTLGKCKSFRRLPKTRLNLLPVIADVPLLEVNGDGGAGNGALARL